MVSSSQKHFSSNGRLSTPPRSVSEHRKMTLLADHRLTPCSPRRRSAPSTETLVARGHLLHSEKVRHSLEETASFSPRKWRTFWITRHEKSSFLPNFLRKTCQSGGIATTYSVSTTAPYLPIYRAFQVVCGSVVADFSKFSRARE